MSRLLPNVAAVDMSVMEGDGMGWNDRVRPQTIVMPQTIPPAYSWWTSAPVAGFTEYVRREQLPRMRGTAFGQVDGKLSRGTDVASTIEQSRLRQKAEKRVPWRDSASWAPLG